MPLPEPDGRGFLLVVVPRSPSRPHASNRPSEDQILYPMRSGQTTRFLKPFEVSREYRAYFDRLRSGEERLGAAMRSTWEALWYPGQDVPESSIWVNVVLTPVEPVRHRTDTAWRQRFEAHLVHSPIPWVRQLFAPSRFLISPDRAGVVLGTEGRDTRPRTAAAEVLAKDSSVRVAMRILRVDRREIRFLDGTHTAPTPFVDEIEYGQTVFEAVALAVDLAAQEGLEGLATLAVRIADAGSPTTTHASNFGLARLDGPLDYDEDRYHVGHGTAEPVIEIDVSELWRERPALVATWWEILTLAARNFGAAEPQHVCIKDDEPSWEGAPPGRLPTWHHR